MKVFLSWSGKGSKSHQVAEVLRDWLPTVIQQLKPWLSSQDIKSGSQWQTELNKQLAETSFGIFSITQESKDKPYLLFEAGALSRYVEKESFVCPYYFGIKATDFSNPLSAYQGEESTKEGTLKLIKSINNAIQQDDQISEQVLEKSFEKWWPDLEEKLDDIKHSEPTNTANAKNIREDRELLEEILALSRENESEISKLSDLVAPLAIPPRARARPVAATIISTPRASPVTATIKPTPSVRPVSVATTPTEE